MKLINVDLDQKKYGDGDYLRAYLGSGILNNWLNILSTDIKACAKSSPLRFENLGKK